MEELSSILHDISMYSTTEKQEMVPNQYYEDEVDTKQDAEAVGAWISDEIDFNIRALMELGTSIEQNARRIIRSREPHPEAPMSSIKASMDRSTIKDTIEESTHTKEKSRAGGESTKAPTRHINESHTVAKKARQSPGSNWTTIKSDNSQMTWKCTFCQSGPHWFMYQRNDGAKACRSCAVK